MRDRSDFCYLNHVEYEKCSKKCVWIVCFGKKIEKIELFLVKKDVNTTNVTLLFHIRKAFKSAKETYPSINMSASQISKLEDAIMRFVYMSKMKWVTAIKARTGAERARQAETAAKKVLANVKKAAKIAANLEKETLKNSKILEAQMLVNATTV